MKTALLIICVFAGGLAAGTVIPLYAQKVIQFLKNKQS